MERSNRRPTATEAEQPLVARLLQLTRARGAALTGGDLTTFARLGEERGHLLAELRARGLTERDRAALATIIALDEEQTAWLRARRDAVRQQLAELSRGRAALRGYGRIVGQRYGGLRRSA